MHSRYSSASLQSHDVSSQECIVSGLATRSPTPEDCAAHKVARHVASSWDGLIKASSKRRLLAKQLATRLAAPVEHGSENSRALPLRNTWRNRARAASRPLPTEKGSPTSVACLRLQAQ